ncbi:hypothetical protein ACFVZ3_39825 [Kitasatospora purpeofusca]|uniref:hypothetical protein n=1 Tax=Kitasatospora purpeofusca TaxID=67352 RepID=UPI0036550F63
MMDRHIARYRPVHAPPAWQRVEAEVKATVAAALPDTTYRARDLLTALTRLAVFADHHGHPADARRWLDEAVVEHFTATALTGISEASRANYRARLNAIRTAAFGPRRPGRVPLSGSRASEPYSRAHKGALWAWAAGQPTEELRRGARVLLALGLGCGLDSPEVIPLRGHDVRVLADGACVVAVRGRRARLVLCSRPYEHALAEAARNAGTGWLFRPGSHTRGTNTVTNFTARTTPDSRVPRLVMGRCRATWIVERMDVPVPIPVLLAAAGLDSLHALSRFLPHLRGTSPDAAAAILREMP